MPGILSDDDFPSGKAPPAADPRCRNCWPLPCVELLRLPLPPPAVAPMHRSIDRGGRPRKKARLLPAFEDHRGARASIKKRGAVKRAISDLAEACGQDDETIKKRLYWERKWRKEETLDGNGILSGHHPSTPVWGDDDEPQG